MTEYKFYMLYSPDQNQLRYDELGKAQETARLRAHNEGETVYVLEAIWMYKPSQKLEEQKLTETAPQTGPSQ